MELPSQSYQNANAELRRAAHRLLHIEGVALLSAALVLVADAIDRGSRHSQGVSWVSSPVGAAFLVLSLCSFWYSYRRLTGLKVTERGLEPRGDNVMPWQAIQEIADYHFGIGFRAPGHQEIRINLKALKNKEALMQVISARQPANVRRIRIPGWRSWVLL
jgi:hypothetical protein